MTSILNALRAPGTVAKQLTWQRNPASDAIVNIATDQPVLDNVCLESSSVMLLVDHAASPQIVAATVNFLRHQRGSAISMLMPVNWSVYSRSKSDQRWQHYATRSGIPIAEPGERGWYRLDITDVGGKLDELFLPAELTGADQIIVFPGFPTGNPFDFWRHFVHPHTRLRAGASQFRQQLAVELAAGVMVDYAFRISSHQERLMFTSDDVVAARLIWLCAIQFFSEEQDIEVVNPWEDKQIQTATELEIGVSSGSNLFLRIHSASEQATSFAQFTADRLGCQLIWVN